MVTKKSTTKRPQKQSEKESKSVNQNKKRNANEQIPPIVPSTPYGVCGERLSAFGGLLALVKFLDLTKFKEVFDALYVSPKREVKLGCYRMILGLLSLLFVGFQRIGHFKYIREDSMLCGILKVTLLPVVSTFWRYLRSLTII